MNIVKMTFKIDLDNEEQVKLAKQFMADLKGTAGDPTVEAKMNDVRLPKPEVKENASKAAATDATSSSKNTGTKTLEEVKTLQATKVEDHRAEIKAKLAEFGAENASSLDAEHYDAYFAWLGTLE